MGQFGIALQMALDSSGWTQSDAAEKSGIVSQPTIGRYIRGISLPEPEKLEALIARMEDRVRENVVAAYLNDHVPASVSGKIKVELSDHPGGRKEDVVYGRAPHGSILRQDLDKLELLALKNPNLAKTINYMVASLEGTFGPSPYDDDPLSVREEPDGADRPEEKILARVQRKKARAAAS